MIDPKIKLSETLKNTNSSIELLHESLAKLEASHLPGTTAVDACRSALRRLLDMKQKLEELIQVLPRGLDGTPGSEILPNQGDPRQLLLPNVE